MAAQGNTTNVCKNKRLCSQTAEGFQPPRLPIATMTTTDNSESEFTITYSLCTWRRCLIQRGTRQRGTRPNAPAWLSNPTIGAGAHHTRSSAHGLLIFSRTREHAILFCTANPLSWSASGWLALLASHQEECHSFNFSILSFCVFFVLYLI